SGHAQRFWSVGFKMGYTFGGHGGVTGGVEASYMLSPFTGFTFDLTGWGPHSHTSFHAGAEGWDALGIDVGPTYFLSDEYTGFGVSVIGWTGFFLYPYYEVAIPFRGPPFQSVGGYLKVPVNFPKDYFDVG